MPAGGRMSEDPQLEGSMVTDEQPAVFNNGRGASASATGGSAQNRQLALPGTGRPCKTLSCPRLPRLPATRLFRRRI
ncbi:unnamed protein product [Vitrella brassicaformis CCMP3155]|uniref:Uncharacterized protein n=1 Tax=Vitrella brassicaformis (strain CCMP3155) TaxID=1169540 RepID=A0A0G4GZW1_VITBC|nr:unnamed protein product [Vitrella brassicaformis CCMP3155]|eukprot:CEM36732.1 unnamed protein product [Vitrella brassicaformis CCMP3155]